MGKAMKDGVVIDEQYPFDCNKYYIPTGQNIKKALQNSLH
jgi:hypothetical protein